MHACDELGLIHLYCGDGKGKTTAAMGLALRAAGHGKRVLVAQFLKSSPTGELAIFSQIETISVLRSEKKFPFTFQMNEAQKQEITDIHNTIFNACIEAYEINACDLLIFDELISAYNYGLIDTVMVDHFFTTHHKKIELVMTGRDPSERLIDMADYVSEIKKIKHPYDRNIAARTGIER